MSRTAAVLYLHPFPFPAPLQPASPAASKPWAEVLRLEVIWPVQLGVSVCSMCVSVCVSIYVCVCVSVRASVSK